MTKRLKIFACVAAIGGLALTAPTHAATPKDQLVIGMNMVNLTSLDPHNVNSYESYHVIANLYDTLLRNKPGKPGEFEPALATGWTIGADGSIEFKLNENAKFQSGKPVTAQDVAYSLQRAVRLGLLSKTYYSQWGYNNDNVEDLFVAVDDHTFLMKPATMVAPALKLASLTRAYGVVLEKAVVLENEKNGDMGRGWLASHSAGSGPFTLNRWNPNDIALLDRYSDYWAGEPTLRRVIIRHLPESQTQRLQLEHGDLDVGFQLVSADIDALSKNPAITIDRLKGSGFYYMIMSTKDQDFAKPEVRKALRYCINFTDINNVIMKNYGEATKTFIPEDIAGYTGDVEGNVYDPQKCKELMVKAGYPDGFEKNLLVLNSTPYSDIATAVQQNLSTAGVKVKIVTGNGDQTYGPLRNREFQIGIGRTASSTPEDADGWIRTHAYNPDNADNSNTTNLQAWRSSFQLPEVNKLIDEASAITGDDTKRVELYQKALIDFEGSAPPIIPISRRVDPFAMSARLSNYVADPSWMTRWNAVEKKN